MPANMPRELRAALVALVREKPAATKGQIVKIFESRTGRRISPSTVHYVKHRLGSDPNGYHLTIDQRATLRDLIELSAPLYCWLEIAGDFERAAGRRISPRTVSAMAYGEMGISPIGKTVAYKFGVRNGGIAGKVEAASAAKLADAPYRPGYFPKSYRGPDGGPSGDAVRVHRTTGPARGIAGGER